jgi:large subunit ribosomal protein L2
MCLRDIRVEKLRVNSTFFNSFVHTNYKKVDRGKKILKKINRSFGRNNTGVITCRNRGGGNKRLYRNVTFKMKERYQKGIVRRIDYDPNRSSKIALVYYYNGSKGYIIEPNGIRVGKEISSAPKSRFEIGNCLALANVNLGANLYNVELSPGSCGKIARSAGTSVKVISRENGFVSLNLPSGEIRLVSEECMRIVGQVGNGNHGKKKKN